MLPTVLAAQLEEGLADYLETTFPMHNAPFRGSLRQLTASDKFRHEPFITVRLPFRKADKMPTCFEAIHPQYLPYVHQQRAFDRLTGDDGRSTLIATGTGSGKTECFLYPILEYCYQHRLERGIKALIIYPMNALASDQARRIAELISGSPEMKNNIRVGMYVGGHEAKPAKTMTDSCVITDHQTLLDSPPDILLTNYKMLDYLLVRPRDAKIWEANQAETLKYIAVDELHTFDGAQGTDLACLLRRLKARLNTPGGWLCCVGTSATMGSPDEAESITKYASEMFNEWFGADAVVTEDRLPPEEFFAGSDITETTIPTNQQIKELVQYVDQDEEEAYLRHACEAWLPEFTDDLFSDEGRLALTDALMHHGLLQAAITKMRGSYWQASKLAEELNPYYAHLAELENAEAAMHSLFALVAHARSGEPGKLRPFLNVQVQLWVRELRRLLAKVSSEKIEYAVFADLNAQQAKQYLPVVNCRDCGATGWASVLNERQNASLPALEPFYNRYFKTDDKVIMMFPEDDQAEASLSGFIHGKLCQKCLQVRFSGTGSDTCECCGEKMFPVLIPNPIPTSGTGSHKQYNCPFCRSKNGIFLVGLRSASEIGSSLSQIFASKFNDDKKALAFSDNVQDAAHKAGFFNSRTWKFGLRCAIQKYVLSDGAGKNLSEFMDGFLNYWHSQFKDDDYIGFFIAPNMVWMPTYEDLINKRIIEKQNAAKELIYDIDRRLSYEILLEYGLRSTIGRTLEKSNCSVLAYPEDLLCKVIDRITERLTNEYPNQHGYHVDAMVIGYLHSLRQNGAFYNPVYKAYIDNPKSTYVLSNDHVPWMPGVHTYQVPRYLTKKLDGKFRAFDTPTSKRYTEWIQRCIQSQELLMSDMPDRISEMILEELLKCGLLCVCPSEYAGEVYHIDSHHVLVSSQVTQVKCDCCGAVTAVAKDNLSHWLGAPCLRRGCSGTLTEHPDAGLNYYGKLYTSGDLARINAREHTGLLERNDREELEHDFKLKKTEAKIWDPNVLSCTPTMEMGIDIGDLSTVILCNVPPAQAQFLQRTGRAGRKDGNALTLAIANTRPHDLYFYADPLDMMQGSVTPPKIFLEASAVLERQFIAYCMDSWVKREHISPDAIPKKIGICLNKLTAQDQNDFPFNFLQYVKKNMTYLLNSFLALFTQALDSTVENDIRDFGYSDNPSVNSEMQQRIFEAFLDLKEQRDALNKSIEQLEKIIEELKAKPKDPQWDKDIKDVESEKMALINVLQELNKKNVFNFMSDEGLLPNYAFPETGIVLKAILYRKSDPYTPVPAKQKYGKSVYEYSRSAASAISEFAPNNSFYVDGKKLTIDQVDLNSAKLVPWRLCPNCSYAQIEETGKNVAACPRCGCAAWADSGQVRNMLRVQMVYSNMDYKKSVISDDNDDRTAIFYTKSVLVDVDEEHDITAAYQMDNKEFYFGYEFVRKAMLREINFGESDMVGERVSVCGDEQVRKGFKVCKYCGKIQISGKKPNHAFYCKTRKMLAPDSEPYEECMFLYREFATEALRLLIPATSMDSTMVRVESFAAAFMLGMKEKFGNVDHLRMAISSVPVNDADYRKNYLVVYDSVPGGTGYLKQLLAHEDSLIEVFEKALRVLEQCECKHDGTKDGCYHCIYAYRQSNSIGSISKKSAISMLKAILSGKNNQKKIDKLSSISVNPIFDSELEARFIEALRQTGTESRKVTLTDILIDEKRSYLLQVNGKSWEVEPQVNLGHDDEVAVKCKPDFVIRPIDDTDKLPVAVFMDGFTYHKDKVADDTLKRTAILRSGRYRVWALSWNDIHSGSQHKADYATDTLTPANMPGPALYQSTLKQKGVADMIPEKCRPLELLMRYLEMDHSDAAFFTHAQAYSLALLQTQNMQKQDQFDVWNHGFTTATKAINPMLEQLSFGQTIFGTWHPLSSNQSIVIYSGVSVTAMKADPNTIPYVTAVLMDKPDEQFDTYEKEWNGFWHFFNIMQFNPNFSAVSTDGIAKFVYTALPAFSADTAVQTADSWAEAWDYILDDNAKDLAHKLCDADIAIPDSFGYEVEGSNGEVIAEMEYAWTDKKIGYLTEDNLACKEQLIQDGWTILTADDENVNPAIFGGEA